jgi:hypothetical protein
MVRKHVHERQFRAEGAHGSADRAHRKRIHYLQKSLRGHLLGSVCDVVRGSIASRSGAARKQMHFVSGIPQSRSEPSHVGFRATLPAVPVGDHQ